MDLTIVAGNANWQQTHAGALADGARALGIQVTRARPRELVKSRMVATWGWRNGKPYRDRGADVLVMERGYLGDRFAWTSLGWNGLNGRGRFPINADPSRFRLHFGDLLKPWKKSGEYVLLVGQVPNDASLDGQDLSGWYRTTARDAARLYGLPVAFRRHPKALERGIRQEVPGTRLIESDLADALAGAKVVITFNSNVGVDAVLSGVPAVAVDKGSMAWEVTAHRVGELAYPDREDWLARLAWCQWSIDEIRSGEALHPVLEANRRAA